MSRFARMALLPLLIIPLLSFGLVEGLYYWFGRYVEKITRTDNTITGPAIPGAANDRAAVESKPGFDDYTVIIQRNLFSSSLEVEEVDSRDPLEGVEASSLEVVLMGTVSGSDDQVRAIIYDKNEKKQELYQVGDYIQQAVIKQILRGRVIINYNGTDEMLDISEARNVSVAKIATAASALVRQKVAGRPVGGPSVTERQPVSPTETQAEGKTATDDNMRKPLRSFSGGLKVKGGSATD